jgi:hypothetical protein
VTIKDEIENEPAPELPVAELSLIDWAAQTDALAIHVQATWTLADIVRGQGKVRFPVVKRELAYVLYSDPFHRRIGPKWCTKGWRYEDRYEQIVDPSLVAALDNLVSQVPELAEVARLLGEKRKP